MTTNIEMNEQSNIANVASTSELNSSAKSNDKLLAIAVVEKNPLEPAGKLGDGISRWVPYGVKSNASLISRKVPKEELFSEIRRLDPVNAEKRIQRAKDMLNEEYDEIRIGQPRQEMVEKRK